MKRIILTLTVGVLFFITSCQNEMPIDFVLPEVDLTIVQDEFVPNEGMIKLGRKLNNPYSLDNMRKALNLLPIESRGGYSTDDIQPTHLYVKFKPDNVSELDALLWSYDSLDFYPYPLDCERTSGGYYHDPSLPENVPTFQYASIPIDHPIPEVCEYEILEELYIPDELTPHTRALSPAFINAIVEKSFKLTDNKYEGDAVATRNDGQTRAYYTYSGSIKVWDDLLNQAIPVVGAVVRCTRWFTTVKAITDSYGNYSMTRESQNEYEYDICWERDGKYDIREGELLQAITDGPKQVSGWSVTMKTDNGFPRGVNFATINRAAYRYLYGNRGGLARLEPHSTGNLKICYKHDYDKDGGRLGSFSGFTSFGITGDIWIWGKKDKNTWINTNMIFATSCHEMAHANHYNYHTVLDFATMDNFIIESWARYVQSLLAYLEYGELNLYNMNIVSYEDFCSAYATDFNLLATLAWPTNSNKDYSCFFIDLYDSHNQWVSGSLYPNDNISGYTATTLNTIINDSQDMNDILSYLKMLKPTGVTDEMLNTFVNYYIQNK